VCNSKVLCVKVEIDPYIGTRLGTRREQYCAENSNMIDGQASEALKWIESQTVSKLKKPFMLTGRLPCSFLQFLIRMSSAKRVLEIGAYTGYSAVSMAATGVSVTTIDSFQDEKESEEIFLQGVKMSGLQIELRRGKALDILSELAKEAISGAEPFDFVFIDADKTEQVRSSHRGVTSAPLACQ
jgi:predicted O-methyltransferase YrrM